MKTFKIQILFLLSLFFISCSTESEDFEVTVTANNQLGKVSGSGIYGFKKDCTVNAYSENNDEYVFSGWYVNEQILSYIPNYTFEVTSDISLEARFTTPDKFQNFTGQIAWQGVRDAKVITYNFSYPLSVNAGESITINYTQDKSFSNDIRCESTIGNVSIDVSKKQLYFSSEEKGIAIITLAGNTSLMSKFCITVR